MLEELHEECGVIGIYNSENVARNVAMGLYALQHRGQESAGIAITNVMRDVIAGDFLTALTKFAEVAIVAMAIAIGIALPVGAVRALLGGV